MYRQMRKEVRVWEDRFASSLKAAEELTQLKQHVLEHDNQLRNIYLRLRRQEYVSPKELQLLATAESLLFPQGTPDAIWDYSQDKETALRCLDHNDTRFAYAFAKIAHDSGYIFESAFQGRIFIEENGYPEGRQLGINSDKLFRILTIKEGMNIARDQTIKNRNKLSVRRNGIWRIKGKIIEKQEEIRAHSIGVLVVILLQQILERRHPFEYLSLSRNKIPKAGLLSLGGYHSKLKMKERTVKIYQEWNNFDQIKNNLVTAIENWRDRKSFRTRGLSAEDCESWLDTTDLSERRDGKKKRKLGDSKGLTKEGNKKRKCDQSKNHNSTNTSNLKNRKKKRRSACENDSTSSKDEDSDTEDQSVVSTVTEDDGTTTTEDDDDVSRDGGCTQIRPTEPKPRCLEGVDLETCSGRFLKNLVDTFSKTNLDGKPAGRDQSDSRHKAHIIEKGKGIYSNPAIYGVRDALGDIESLIVDSLEKGDLLFHGGLGGRENSYVRCACSDEPTAICDDTGEELRAFMPIGDHLYAVFSGNQAECLILERLNNVLNKVIKESYGRDMKYYFNLLHWMISLGKPYGKHNDVESNHIRISDKDKYRSADGSKLPNEEQFLTPTIVITRYRNNKAAPSRYRVEWYDGKNASKQPIFTLLCSGNFIHVQGPGSQAHNIFHMAHELLKEDADFPFDWRAVITARSIVVPSICQESYRQRLRMHGKELVDIYVPPTELLERFPLRSLEKGDMPQKNGFRVIKPTTTNHPAEKSITKEFKAKFCLNRKENKHTYKQCSEDMFANDYNLVPVRPLLTDGDSKAYLYASARYAVPMLNDLCLVPKIQTKAQKLDENGNKIYKKLKSGERTPQLVDESVYGWFFLHKGDEVYAPTRGNWYNTHEVAAAGHLGWTTKHDKLILRDCLSMFGKQLLLNHAKYKSEKPSNGKFINCEDKTVYVGKNGELIFFFGSGGSPSDGGSNGSNLNDVWEIKNASWIATARSQKNNKVNQSLHEMALNGKVVAYFVSGKVYNYITDDHDSKRDDKVCYFMGYYEIVSYSVCDAWSMHAIKGMFSGEPEDFQKFCRFLEGKHAIVHLRWVPDDKVANLPKLVEGEVVNPCTLRVINVSEREKSYVGMRISKEELKDCMLLKDNSVSRDQLLHHHLIEDLLPQLDSFEILSSGTRDPIKNKEEIKCMLEGRVEEYRGWHWTKKDYQNLKSERREKYAGDGEEEIGKGRDCSSNETTEEDHSTVVDKKLIPDQPKGSVNAKDMEDKPCYKEIFDVYNNNQKEKKMTIDTWLEIMTNLSYCTTSRGLGECLTDQNDEKIAVPLPDENLCTILRTSVTPSPQRCWDQVNIALRLDEKICNQLGEGALDGKRVKIASVDNEIFHDKLFKAIISMLTSNPALLSSCSRDGNFKHGAAIPGLCDAEAFITHIKNLKAADNAYHSFLVNGQCKKQNPIENYEKLICFVETLHDEFRKKIMEKVFKPASRPSTKKKSVRNNPLKSNDKYCRRKIVKNLAMLLKDSSTETTFDDWMFISSEIMKVIDELYDLAEHMGEIGSDSVVMGPGSLEGARRIIRDRKRGKDNIDYDEEYPITKNGRKWRWQSEVINKHTCNEIREKISKMSEDELLINGFIKDKENVVRHEMNARPVGPSDYEHWLCKGTVILRHKTTGWLKTKQPDLTKSYCLPLKYTCPKLVMEDFLMSMLRKRKEAYKRWSGGVRTPPPILLLEGEEELFLKSKEFIE